MKRRGKSSPLPRQRGGHCKPRPAQDLRAFRAVRSLFDIARAYRQRYAQTDDRPRQNSAYRPSCFFEKYARAFMPGLFSLILSFLRKKNKSTMSHIVFYFRCFTVFLSKKSVVSGFREIIFPSSLQCSSFAEYRLRQALFRLQYVLFAGRSSRRLSRLRFRRTSYRP